MEAKATAKYLKGSPQKARLVIDLVRGKKVEDALGILKFSPRRAARLIEKVLRSAIANAEHKSATVDLDELTIKEICVNQRPDEMAQAVAPGAHGPRLPSDAEAVSHNRSSFGRERTKEE